MFFVSRWYDLYALENFCQPSKNKYKHFLECFACDRSSSHLPKGKSWSKVNSYFLCFCLFFILFLLITTNEKFKKSTTVSSGFQITAPVKKLVSIFLALCTYLSNSANCQNIIKFKMSKTAQNLLSTFVYLFLYPR